MLGFGWEGLEVENQTLPVFGSGRRKNEEERQRRRKLHFGTEYRVEQRKWSTDFNQTIADDRARRARREDVSAVSI